MICALRAAVRPFFMSVINRLLGNYRLLFALLNTINSNKES
nr:MAG TPA: hypothetical protein [Caudoviricetes sp.]DAY72371.1 MAG TPA: hypothetical protein [Caudoviricetes sp.]